MLISRLLLKSHLDHIYLSGQLQDVALVGQFQTVGVSVNKTVMVTAGPLQKSEPLAAETGITNLGLLIKALDSVEDDQVSLEVAERHIVITMKDRVVKLVTSSMNAIGSRPKENVRALIAGLIPANVIWTPLEHTTVDGILGAARMLKADLMILEVGAKGSNMIVGDPKMNAVEFSLPDVKAAADFRLLLPAEGMIAVLDQITDFAKAEICLTGPDSVIGIREGQYEYIVSPDKDPEAKKPVA